MKIAIDSGALKSGHSVRGIGFYTKNLIIALEKITRNKTDITISAVDFNKEKLSLYKYDIIHFPYFDIFLPTLPQSKITKTILTIHDVTPLLYPKHYPPGIRGKINFFRQKKHLKKVDHIITDTECSKKDIVRYLSIDPKNITPIHLAPADHFKKLKLGSWANEIRRKYSLPEKFVLYVGDVNYNKNISVLIDACEKISIPLVIVGKQAMNLEEGQESLKAIKGPQDWIRYILGKSHPELAHLSEILNRIQSSKLVQRLGFVPDDDLVKIYNLANVYCQPSLYEGFGLPVLEAMACGAPVVISRTQALVEIANGRAIIADTNNSTSFSKAIRKLLNDKKLSINLSKNGLEYVKNFSWDITAKKTIDVYTKVCTI